MDQSSIQDIHGEKILFSPLNWGWGHVMRSIPLLRQLQLQENKITIACSIEQKEVYTFYLDAVSFLQLQGYPFHFEGKGRFEWDLVRKGFSLSMSLAREKSWVKKRCANHDFTLILSEHRYGFRSSVVRSIFITHQVHLPLSYLFFWVQGLHHFLLRRFDELWIVDELDQKFAGNLSANLSGFPSRYLGTLSRFDSVDNYEDAEKRWTTILISGPEPYAEQFFTQMVQAQDLNNTNICFIYSNTNYDIPTHARAEFICARENWSMVDKRLSLTKKLICRSGYSTIMDVASLDCEVEYFATPGQAEQVYLAQRHKKNPAS